MCLFAAMSQSDYQRFVGQRDVTTIDDFSHQAVRRDVVDMVIAQQALQLGGFKALYLSSRVCQFP